MNFPEQHPFCFLFFMFDLVSIGDAMQDIFVKLKEAEVVSSSNHLKLNLCVSFADKIPAEAIDMQVAGNAANVAVGSSRLGLKTAFYTIVGDDEAGSSIRRKLKGEKVDDSYVLTDKGKINNYSIVLSHKGERTIIIYHEPRHYKLPRFQKTQWIYLTSLGNNISKKNSFFTLHEQLLQYLKTRPYVHLAFNPGTYQLRMEKKLLNQVLKQVEIVFVNVEEAQSILELSEKTNIKKILFQLSALGPKIVVITDGANGSFAYSEGKFYTIGVFPTEMVERTGAGDSFAIGTLSALFYGEDLSKALRWGAVNSASVVSKVGPIPGLLTKKQMLNTLKKHHNFKSKCF
jgi:sugar/nucleoside kinase (ribokinase family)